MMGLIFLFSSIPGDEFPSWTGVIDLVVSKSGHMIGYGILAGTYLRGVGDSSSRGYRLAWAMAVVYGVSDELHQAFVPGRMNSIWDVGINAVGALLGLVWLRYFLGRVRNHNFK
jgi:VanZ family protein